MESWQRAVLFCLFAWIFFSLAGIVGFYGHSSDNKAHQDMALDVTVSPGYAPLLRSISWPFAFNQIVWVFWVMFLLAFVTPLLLYAITKNAWVTFFYFATTSYFFYFIQGAFAQGLMLIFVLSLLATKNNYLRLVLVGIGWFSHSTAPMFLSLVFVCVLLNENWRKIKKLFSGITLGCSAFWGKQEIPKVINEPVALQTISGNEVSWRGTVITLNNFFALFVKIVPLPFFLVALKKLWQLKRFDLLFLTAFCLIGAFEFGSRIWYFLPIPMLIGFTLHFKDSPHKKFWLSLVALSFVFQIYSWINFNLLC